MDALEKAKQKDLLLIRLKKIHRTVQKKDRENLERILDELATKSQSTSAELDEVNAEIAGIKKKLKKSLKKLEH